ncbi:MAG: sensor histidine kinase [Leptospirillia bacterium]
MASHELKARRMADKLLLSPEEVDRRKSYLGISPDDERALSSLESYVRDRAPEFVERLHERILLFPDAAAILEKAQAQSWLKVRHAEYFVELVSGQYDMDYVLNRLAVGITHQEIGLGPEWVQASFGLFLEWTLQCSRQDLSSPLAQNPALMEILSKVTLFDSGLVMDSYFMAEREKAEVLSRVFDTNAEVVWILDGQGRIRHANRTTRTLTGYSPEEIVSRPVPEFLLSPGDGPPPRLTDLEESAAQEGHWQGELVVRRSDGLGVTVWATLNLLGEEKGQGTILEFRDRTAEKKTEQDLVAKTADLVRSNRDLEQFAYVASHDLQEPLRMVTSYTQLLARRYKGQLSAEADEFIGFAVDGAVRMQALINALLAYSRVDSRGKPLVVCDMNSVLDHALDNLRLALEESGASIVRGELPRVMGDPVQLMQVLQNLVGNALKFRAKDRPPVVTVGAEREGDLWAIRVSDNGIGIDSQYFDRIFVIFQRLHTKEEYPGTGIGLAMCKRIVERHGGTIGVDSTLGSGTTFTLTLRGAGEAKDPFSPVPPVD